MAKIELERYGEVIAGENEGFFIFVHYDERDTGGYYILLVNDIENPSDGGDYWVKDTDELINLFQVSDWQVEWRR
ncbi:hypothetical protein AB0M47_33750 [Hamadaea sp. NPDC051192]|uniref:hypothetical protein n=1 Tax=Hamadaea sp. NPDC051192 TaxID=3154940 RepID=UPI0034180FD8